MTAQIKGTRHVKIDKNKYSKRVHRLCCCCKPLIENHEAEHVKRELNCYTSERSGQQTICRSFVML